MTKMRLKLTQKEYEVGQEGFLLISEAPKKDGTITLMSSEKAELDARWYDSFVAYFHAKYPEFNGGFSALIRLVAEAYDRFIDGEE